MIAMSSEAEFQCNKLLKLDNTMLMYGIYNAETLEKLINTVRELHNVTSSHEKLFAGEHNPSLFRILYTNASGVQQYTFNCTKQIYFSVCYLQSYWLQEIHPNVSKFMWYLHVKYVSTCVICVIMCIYVHV